MEELPCFLSFEHSSFLLGNCGYEPNPLNIFPILVHLSLGILAFSFTYFSLKYWKNKNRSQSLDKGVNQ